MVSKKVTLPSHPWQYYEKNLKLLAEREEKITDKNDFLFLIDLGFITNNLELSKRGRIYFEAKFIKSNDDIATKILREALITFPPALAILQLLYGVKNAPRDNALSILKSRGYWNYPNHAPLTNLLDMMNQAGLVVYSRKCRTLKVLFNPAQREWPLPDNIFIEPSRPFSNIIALKKILEACTGFIYWLDKHFQKEALEIIWEIADANKIKEIAILSLDLEQTVNKSARKYYKRLKKELHNKGVRLGWFVIDNKLIKDTHDRWVLTETTGWNLPNCNAIFSGQRSEIHKTENFKELIKIFKNYLKKASEIC